MKNFIKKFILLSLPVFSIIILVNYYGDAASLFKGGYEKEMAKVIESGQYISNISDFDDRLFQRELINSDKIKPGVVVFGSSRAMLISSLLYGDSSLFNNSVYFACIQDIVAMYQIYKANHKLPKKILIGIDPWLLSENKAHTRWKSIGSYYEAFTGNSSNPEAGNAGADISKYEQLFSISYFQSSLKILPAKFKGSSKPVPTKEKYNIEKTRLTDGSMVYGQVYRNISANEVENIIKTTLSKDVYTGNKLYVVSDEVWNLFKKMIADMKQNNTEVEFFLAPFPKPIYYKRADNYNEIEEIVRNYAKAEKIKVWGTYNSNILGMDNSYFFDDRHCNEKAMKEIFKKTN